ncbi:MAG: glycosyl hydrolase [Anaerolineae bacterium]|nr:glycosyl hydrolase [Anaerolineae bacterium]
MNLDGILEWRCIGPFRGGRVVAVAGDVRQQNVFYFGACAGGVWKSDDAGTYWQNISDGWFNTASVGALAVSEADPNVIYAGTGETTIRLDVTHGDGVYRSTDGGRSWSHPGLQDTRHIAKVRIHPDNPDIAWVAALGHAFGPNRERGVFKTVDGGENWRQVLFKSEKAGAIDLSVDVNNPRIVYAAFWEAYRNFWQISSGGPDSGLWMSEDGGESWQDISRNPGLPDGIRGKIGVAASPAQPGRVWALMEATVGGGMFRSDDYGATWEHVAANDELISRGWYYMHLTPDPLDGDTVYVNNLKLWKSVDGGHNYEQISTPHGDNHDLWIDPDNPRRMIQGNDGGACVSLNGGSTWSTQFNQPTSQFYRMAADSRDPYVVYGTQQDNSSVAVPSQSPLTSITWADCWPAGTGESGYIAVRPDNPDVLYVGAIGSSPGGGNSLQRYDHRAQQIRLISTWPEAMRGEAPADCRYRFAWTYPIVISPHDPDTLYVGGNQVLRSGNEGQSWEEISPDLTRADPETLRASGGPVNREAVGAETYATVFALAESPLQQGLLWAGSDDGLVHITRDAGRTWMNVTPSDLEARTQVSTIEASPHEAGTAWMACTRYKLDDNRPMLWRTRDYGASWHAINEGIREGDFTRVIREDPLHPGLLYAGSETGVYVSFDSGDHWQALQFNLPVAPVYDLLVKGSDLIAATHGRSFWILDDLTALRQLDASPAATTLLKPRPATRLAPKVFERGFGDVPGKSYMGVLGVLSPYTETTSEENQVTRTFLDSGCNPPKGAVFTWWLSDEPEQAIQIEVLDAGGNVVRRFRSLDDETRALQKTLPREAPREVFLTANKGWNRFVWDLRYEEAPRLAAHDAHAGAVDGPVANPGQYTLRLRVGDDVLEQVFEVVKDPHSDAQQADLQAQFDLLIEIRDLLSETHAAVNRMRELRASLAALAGRRDIDESVSIQAQALHDQVLAIEKELMLPDLKAGWPDFLNHGVQLANKLATLSADVSAGDYRPTDQAQEVFAMYDGQIRAVLKRLADLESGELASFNRSLIQAQVTPVGA